MAYILLYKEQAQKDLAKIPVKWRQKIICVLNEIAIDPFRGKKLKGELSGIYSFRVWPYRILYEIVNSKLIIFVLRIGHRQNVYQ